MEKEEAINILNGYMGGEIDPESTELYHAIELVVDILESQSSLPSNLDEAAKDYCDSQPGWENKMNWVEEKDKEECRRDFKAGAEWMAGQIKGGRDNDSAR